MVGVREMQKKSGSLMTLIHTAHPIFLPMGLLYETNKPLI